MRTICPTLLVLAVASACQKEAPPGANYFDRVIQPILDGSCSKGTSGCHKADPGDPFAFAAGNLDTSSFENIHKRPDTLRQYGVYPVPLLLIKALGTPSEVQIVYRGEPIPLQIPHAGGSVFSISSDAYQTLAQWLAKGATTDGVRPPPTPVQGNADCTPTVPESFVEGSITSTPEWTGNQAAFDAVQTIITAKGCSATNCHGAPQSDFFLTCGQDARQRAWNFRILWAFSVAPPEDSEILNRPVGNGSHTGGAHFEAGDADFNTLKAFLTAVGEMPDPLTGPKQFFGERVMPILLQRGCALEGCHSSVAMNDLKLRAGGQGFYSSIALEKSYAMMRDEFMAFEVPDIRRGRAVAKNIPEALGGIKHRGGPLLEASPDAAAYACTAPYNPATSSAYCTIAEWARLERAAMGDPNPGNTVNVVYVQRKASHVATLQDFATYQGGSDLMKVTLTMNADGTASAGTATSILGPCGIDTAVVDVRAPDVKYDGDTVAFAMRKTQSDTLHIYTVGLSGGPCTQVTTDANIHDLDPAWSPDGSWIVFASTRAGGTTRRFNLPQSDIWRIPAGGGTLERVTYLTNSELGPQFMRDGRISMTTEKVDVQDPANGFYQLSGRRINWDRTDYHPLLGQRARSPVIPAEFAGDARDSIGYAQATEIREGLNGNFVAVFGPAAARAGGGDIAIFNRSIGPFERGRNDRGYLASVKIHGADGGAYRSPAQLPDGQILASYAPGIDLGAATSIPFKLHVVHADGMRDVVAGLPGESQVEAALALESAPRTAFYHNRRQLVFGGSSDAGDPAHANVHFPDVPMIATLLGSNLRRGRHVEAFDVDGLAVYDASGSLVGSAPLAADGSVRLRVPSGTPVYLGLLKGTAPVFRMSEEHQLGPGESISLGIRRQLFDNVCGGCHGSNSGREIDAAVKGDALTGASESLSLRAAPVVIGP